MLHDPHHNMTKFYLNIRIFLCM